MVKKTHKLGTEKKVLDNSVKSSWELWDTLLICVLLIVLITHISLYSGLKHLPGPVYGGDLYRNRGFVMNTYEGNLPWTSFYFLNASAYYPWPQFALMAYTAKFTGISVNKVMNFFPVFATILLIISAYMLGCYIFRNKSWGLALSSLFLAYNGITYNPVMLMLPFMLWSILFWFKLENTPSLKNAILTGLFIGAIGLVRTSEELLLVLIFAVTVIFRYVKDLINKNSKGQGSFVTITIEYIKKYWAVPVLTFLVTLPILIPIYIYHHFKTLNPAFRYAESSVSNLGILWVFKTLFNLFINRSGVFQFLLGILCLFGLVICFVNKKKTNTGLIAFWFVIIPIMSLHPLITKPLLNFWFLPGKILNPWFLVPLLAIYGLKGIYDNIKNRISSAKFIAMFLLVMVLPFFIMNVSAVKSDRWYQYGMQMDTHTAILYEVGDWLRLNVGNDEAILSNDEDGFALTGLSGKKVVVARRTHVSYYVDIDQRIADAAIIFYGNNSILRDHLINQYSVSYFYLGHMLSQSPMLVPLKFKDYLRSNGVSFREIKGRLDIAVPDAEVFDLIEIYPQDLSKDFTDKLILIKEFGINDQVLSKIYKVGN